MSDRLHPSAPRRRSAKGTGARHILYKRNSACRHINKTVWWPVYFYLKHKTHQNCITFVHCWTNVENVGPTLCKCYSFFCVYCDCLSNKTTLAKVLFLLKCHAHVKQNVRVPFHFIISTYTSAPCAPWSSLHCIFFQIVKCQKKWKKYFFLTTCCCQTD